MKKIHISKQKYELFSKNMKNSDLKTEILRIKYEYGVTQAIIAGRVKVAPTYLSDMLNGRVEYNDTFKKKLLEEFPNKVQHKNSHLPQKTGDKMKSIPLLSFSVAAGYMNNNNGADAFHGEQIAFSDFSDRGADCAIRVEGDSMRPRYNNGDILAIRILDSPSFFQWGKVYVLNTAQGCVIKKLFPDPDDEDKIICHSENFENYPDYKITKADVLGVAIVVGHAGVE